MTPQELKNSILQLAIQGKLVEQKEDEGTALELLLDCEVSDSVDRQKVRQKIITDILDSEKEFDIPSSWEWVKLGDVCTIARGGSPRPIKEFLTDAEDGINWIKIGDISKNDKYIYSTAEKIKPSGVSKSRMIYKGDFLLTNSMSFGRPYISKIDGCIHDGWLVISQNNEVFNQDFLYYLLSSYYAYAQFSGKVSGAVVKNLNSDKVANSVFPLPPLAEQKRIVKKIEEILPLIERYEEAWVKLEDFNNRFPDDMKKSLLQHAIQGKLVEQRENEGSGEELYKQIQSEKQKLIKQGKIKKQKPLPEILEDEIPFDIPDSWKWVKFGDIVNYNMGKTPPRAESEWWKNEFPWVCISDMIENGHIIETKEGVSNVALSAKFGNRISKAGTMLMSFKLTVGRVSILNIDAVHNEAIISIYPYCDADNIFQAYLFNLLPLVTQHGDTKKAIKGKTLNSTSINNLLIPLPPLAEQKRIVAKLEELLPLCDKLK
ncbi:MAG: restriction endonuclease subunit S [Campylobacteraceae bacterium]|nr:restriction endonuclease subunit S [Campylobacteraceae bacterium]